MLSNFQTKPGAVIIDHVYCPYYGHTGQQAVTFTTVVSIKNLTHLKLVEQQIGTLVLRTVLQTSIQTCYIIIIVTDQNIAWIWWTPNQTITYAWLFNFPEVEYACYIPMPLIPQAAWIYKWIARIFGRYTLCYFSQYSRFSKNFLQKNVTW